MPQQQPLIINKELNKIQVKKGGEGIVNEDNSKILINNKDLNKN